MKEDLIIIDDIRDVAYFQRPCRLNLMLITLVEQGSIGGKADLISFKASESSLLFLFPDELIEYRETSEDLRIKVIAMSESFSKSLQTNESFSAFFRLKNNPVVKLKDTDLEIAKGYFRLISLINGSDNDGRSSAMKHLFTSFFYMVSHLEGYLEVVNVEKSQREQLFERFHQAVTMHYKESMEVQYYADKLCMAPKYMARIIKEVSGKPAKQWIDEYVILEAKSLMLNDAKMTLLEISEELGFPNQSFFTQFFKKYTGLTPSQFRNNLGKVK